MITIFVYILFIILLLVEVQSCHNQCNKNGMCSDSSTCECFTGWYKNNKLIL